MASIRNLDQVGKSVRTKAEMTRIADQTYSRVYAKLGKYSTERIISLLPRTRVDGRDHNARRARRNAIGRAAVQVLRDRDIEIQEWMYGGNIPNGQYRGAYKAVPGL